MLYLTTGTPGAGKSLWTIWHVEQRRLKEGRAVYYYNIKGLVLDWNELTLDQVLRWWELPQGSIIVIDEAQDVFPKGSTAQKPPEHADRIAKHRHGGYDIYLVSQHPMKLDANVRKDVEEHRHLMRKFGTTWSTVHLWKGCRDNCDKTRKDSIATQWRYPREAYAWYKSAEVHTVRLAVPLKVWAMAIVPVLVAGLAWWVFWGREAARKPDQAKPAIQAGAKEASPARQAGPGATIAGYRAPQSAQAYAAAYKPRIEDLPYSAPRYDELTAPTRVPVVVGCWVVGEDAWCVTQQGTKLKPTVAFARSFIERGQFLDFDPDGRERDAGQAGGDHQAKAPARRS